MNGGGVRRVAGRRLVVVSVGVETVRWLGHQRLWCRVEHHAVVGVVVVTHATGVDRVHR